MAAQFTRALDGWQSSEEVAQQAKKTLNQLARSLGSALL
jgi:hypothetical protein